MSEATRSPLKDKPLRNPGQSVEEARQKLLEDKLETPFLLTAVLIALAGMEWWRYFAKPPPQPILFSVVGILATAFAAWRFWRIRPQMRAMRLAIDGEKAVGQFLESLRQRGFRVFHDIVTDGFNLDHVIIGPAGVFTIETKTWRKPARGEPKIRFDGEKVVAGGFEPDRDPVTQAKAQASWLRRLLEESTGKVFAVRPVIVFPGWFVEQSPGSTKDVWVLEPKALPGFVSREPTALSEADIRLASFHLSRFIRSQEQRRGTT